MSLFIELLSGYNYKWITNPRLICEHLLTEADISIPLKCYDDIESLAKQKTDWIANYHEQQQEEQEKQLIEAATKKKKELDEKFDNGEFSDGSDQEQEPA